jgi:hypothetical protein
MHLPVGEREKGEAEALNQSIRPAPAEIRQKSAMETDGRIMVLRPGKVNHEMTPGCLTS